VVSEEGGPRPLLRPADVRRLLDAHGLAPTKRFGQNFVVDANTVRKVARDAGVGPGDLVCEIGPGLGSLTLALREAGARVVAIEVDAGMVRALGEVVGDDPEVRVVHADALTVDLGEVLAGQQAALVANLPYNVATPIVLRCLRSRRFSRLLVMVQREVGRRWVARVGDPLYAAVSVKVAALAEARIAATVKRGAFLPVPNVESVTVRLDPVPWLHPVGEAELFALVEGGFAQRRKRLRNALAAGGATDGSPVATAAEVETALAAAGLDPGARAEELDLDGWVRLAVALGLGPPPGDVHGG
jgi:16S rRNA (adenine1518-N6/adenine1519-N6)-dimethyltransferase